MTIQLLIYLCSMIAVYFFAEHRKSVGYVWTIAYFLLAWLLEALSPPYLTAIYALLAISIILTCEVLIRLGVDPFSPRSIQSGVKRGLNFIKLSPKTEFLQAKDHPSAVKAIQLMEKSDWRQLHQFISNLGDSDRHTVYQALAENETNAKQIKRWLEVNPDCEIAHVVSGFKYIHRGWQIRGSGTADQVAAKAWKQFFIALSLAEQAFQKAINIKDNCSNPYVGLITVAMGASIGVESLWKYFAKGASLSPRNYQLYSAMIHACAPKWGGDASDMFEVAKTVCDEAPRKSAVRTCLIAAHVEHWLSLSMMDEKEMAGKYFQQSSVRNDIKHVYSEVKSLDHSRLSHVEAKNVLAFCLDKAGMYVEFRELIPQMKNKYVEYPWIYYEESTLSAFDTAYALDHVLKKHGFL